MKHIRKGLALLLSAAGLLATLSGCQTEELLHPNGDTASTSSAATTAAPVFSRNPLTGKNDMNNSSSDRPVGVMIANNDFMQNEQVGIADADMWMETDTEGGITRIMAVFANAERIPDAIGPVRSARSPFVHVVDAMGIAYVHAGGSAPALENIAMSDIADMSLDASEDDSKDAGDSYAWRDMDFYENHDWEFCLRTNGQKIAKMMADRSYSTTAVKPVPWTFGTQTGEQASEVSIRMTSSQTVRFVYDSENKLYDKYNGDTRHCDIDGTPIQAENILVLYTDKFMENDLTIDFYLHDGCGYVFSDGKTRRFDWLRTESGFEMTELDGSPLTLSEGRTYLCVVSTEYEDNISFD